MLEGPRLVRVPNCVAHYRLEPSPLPIGGAGSIMGLADPSYSTVRRSEMKIITSHERADMDALASMYAASRLFADHIPVLPQNLNRNLRDLIALYKDQFPFVERRDLPRERITEVILVDTQAIAPFRGMDEQTHMVAIDHHVQDSRLAAGVQFEGEPLGATTTLLVERMRARGLGMSAIGASLLLMGIYEDTGSLSYLTTKPRDAAAAAWLLDNGADLNIVNDFLRRPLTELQRQALSLLMSAAEIHTIHDRTICIAAVRLERYVDELSSLIHELMEIYETDACFLLAQHGNSVQIIGRSSTDALDVSELIRPLGGGGHSKAAAGRTEVLELEEVSRILLDGLGALIKPPTRVRAIMSTNVHTLGLDMTVSTAAQLMRRYGHEGFPVVENDHLIGILTRSDVDRALHHGRGETSIRSILYTGPVYVSPDAPVDQVQKVMLENSLGQVPVVEHGRFIGIVTRTDLIKLFSPPTGDSRAQEIRAKMDQALPQGLRELLMLARDAANDLGYSLYVVGGFVRDLLLDAPTLDLDLVVEGDAIRMARRLAEQVDGYVRSHARFGTAKVVLHKERGEGVPSALDFVTARTEFYESPTMLPQVERSSIKQDLYRRDFTINTMAVCLDRGRYGELLDHYGGLRDLQEMRIRVLHNLSFVEDPTRILRAVRFEQRLGFSMEERTAELIADAIELLGHVTGERLRNELFLMLKEAEPEKGLLRLNQLGALEQIHGSLRFHGEAAQRFGRLRGHLRELAANGWEGQPDGQRNVPELYQCYLALLASQMSAEELDSFAHRLRLTSDDARFLAQTAALREVRTQLEGPVMLPSTIYHTLAPFTPEARFVLSVLTDSDRLHARLSLFEKKLAHVAPTLDGDDLKAMGVPPSPVYRVILERIRDALLDGQIATPEQELAMARRLVGAMLE